MECQPKGFDLQGFGHLRGGAQLENFQKGQFSRNLPTSAVNGESWIFRENAQFLSFWQDGRVLDSFFLLALFWEIVIQNVDTPTCREKTPQWSPNGQPKGPTWIWEATDLVKSYSNHIISYHITSYHIISHHIISYHIIYHISYPIIHSWGGSMMMEPTFTKTSHIEVRSSAGYCVSRSPKEAFFNDGSWLQLHEQWLKPWSLLYTQGIIILLSYTRIMSKNSSNYFRIPIWTWSGFHFFMSAVFNS